MIGVGFKNLARTPVPKLSPSYPHPESYSSRKLIVSLNQKGR